MNDSHSIKIEIQQFISELKSVQLATISANGRAEASYTPFLYRAPDFFVFVSMLASHTNNLLNNVYCSLMLIEDESKTANIHRRRRLILSCRAKVMKREEKESELILDAMEYHLGNTINVIRQLPDFFLFRIQVIDGRYVKGFGAAYQTDSELNQSELIKGR